MTKQSKARGFALARILVVAIFAGAGFVGWVANIVKLIASGFDPITGLVVGRIIGVFVAPLGAVLGFL